MHTPTATSLSKQRSYYDTIAHALHYLDAHFTEQPNLDTIAAQVHISPYHFQKLFTDWVGISPKKYLQFLSINYAKQLLQQHTLADTAYATGLSGTSRLHDLFIGIEGMTPGEYKHGGKNLNIQYQFADTPFGEILVAATHKGVCHLAFVTTRPAALQQLQQQFTQAQLVEQTNPLHQAALGLFYADWQQQQHIKLHLKGTAFQLKVWNALLKIPMGQLASYSNIAHYIQQPTASRAVGSAIGNNPVAFLIPCHRVIQASGNFVQYHWGTTRKKAIIGWEVAKTTQAA